MEMLTLSHWIYILVVLAVIIAMIFRRDIVVICLMGIFFIGLQHTGSIVSSTQIVFKALLTAGKEFFGIILIFALMVAMLNSLKPIGADKLMVLPAKKFMKNPTIAFFSLGIIVYVASLFFWPTPAMVLIGPILIPIAINAGLPAMAAAMAFNIMSNGMALSGDLVLQAAPNITAKAGGIEVTSMLTKGGILSIIVGLTAMVVAYIMLRKDFKLSKENMSASVESAATTEDVEKTPLGIFFAIAVPVVLGIVILTMVLENIKGDGSTALLGGTAVIILLISTITQYKGKALEKVIEFLKDGLLFATKIFAPIIPIIGFFFLGGNEVSMILGEGAPKLLFDIGHAVANAIPLNKTALCFGNLIIGLITGLDGSGFSGLPLVGGLASALAAPAGINISTMAAIGQMGAIWSGGGTLMAWAFGLVVAAGVANVKPIDLARKNFIPVMSGLLIATIFAIFFL